MMGISPAQALVLATAWCCRVHLAAAFTPFPALEFFLRLNSRPSDIFTRPPSVTHWDMTGDAILETTANLLREYPNPNIGSSSTEQLDQLLSMESGLTTMGLLRAYYCNEGDPEGRCSLPAYRIRRLISAYEAVIEDIRDANSDTDVDGLVGRTAAAHFDAEQFEDGQKLLSSLRSLVTESITNTRYPQARMYVGQLFHTLQDFYSHSNWIERGETEPYSILGQPGVRIPPEMIAPPDSKTCNNCSRAEEISPVPIQGITTAMYFYNCDSSTNIIDTVNRNYLTSGYSDGGLDMSGVEILKPEGKCSHGGAFDTTSDSPATGGINKDSAAFSISPHADLHAQAAVVATSASVQILQDIRNDVDDDTKFAAFLNLEIPDSVPISAVTGITYVVDTTEGMESILPEIEASLAGVKEQLGDYEQSPTVQFILVTFSGAGGVFSTQDIDEFSSAIGGLSVSEDDDCPDPSIGALIQAVQASEPGSSIFLFTSAPPSDASRIPVLEALISEKTVKIFPIVTSGCSDKRRRSTGHDHRSLFKREAEVDLYNFIAAYSGGQVFNIADPSDIGGLSSLITFSAIEANTVLFKSSVSPSGEYTFPIDEKVRKVTVSVNGEDITSSVASAEGGEFSPEVLLETSSSYIAAIDVANSSFFGEWQLNVSASGSFTTQTVAAASDLEFQYAVLQPDRSSTLGVSRAVGNPVAGLPSALLVTAKGDTEGVLITRFALLGINGEIIFESMEVARFGATTMYGIFQFPLPASAFQVQISGVDGLGNRVSRISTAGAQPSTVDLRLGPGRTNNIRILPGEAGNISFLLTNFGTTANITIQVTSTDLNNGDFSHTITPQRVLVNTFQNVEGTVTVNSLSVDAPTEGPAVRFIVTASADDDNHGDQSDFFTFDVLLEEDPNCPDPVECSVDPCQDAECPRFPTARCVVDFCNGECRATFVRGQKNNDVTRRCGNQTGCQIRVCPSQRVCVEELTPPVCPESTPDCRQVSRTRCAFPKDCISIVCEPGRICQVRKTGDGPVARCVLQRPTSCEELTCNEGMMCRFRERSGRRPVVRCVAGQ